MWAVALLGATAAHAQSQFQTLNQTGSVGAGGVSGTVAMCVTQTGADVGANVAVICGTHGTSALGSPAVPSYTAQAPFTYGNCVGGTLAANAATPIAPPAGAALTGWRPIFYNWNTTAGAPPITISFVNPPVPGTGIPIPPGYSGYVFDRPITNILYLIAPQSSPYSLCY